MKYSQIPELVSEAERFCRGECDHYRLSQILGMKADFAGEYLRNLNMLDQKGRCMPMVKASDVLLALTLYIALAAGNKAAACMAFHSPKVAGQAPPQAEG